MSGDLRASGVFAMNIKRLTFIKMNKYFFNPQGKDDSEQDPHAVYSSVRRKKESQGVFFCVCLATDIKDTTLHRMQC